MDKLGIEPRTSRTLGFTDEILQSVHATTALHAPCYASPMGELRYVGFLGQIDLAHFYGLPTAFRLDFKNSKIYLVADADLYPRIIKTFRDDMPFLGKHMLVVTPQTVLAHCYYAPYLVSLQEFL